MDDAMQQDTCTLQSPAQHAGIHYSLTSCPSQAIDQVFQPHYYHSLMPNSITSVPCACYHNPMINPLAFSPFALAWPGPFIQLGPVSVQVSDPTKSNKVKIAQEKDIMNRRQVKVSERAVMKEKSFGRVSPQERR